MHWYKQLNNFSFAAQLEKQLISERTLSALEVKRKQGVKFGAASCKYKMNRAKKNVEQIKEEQMKKGQCKRARYQQSRDVQAFLRVLRNVMPEQCEAESPASWEWNGMDTKCGRKDKMLAMMKDYKEMDAEGKLFRKWDFDTMDARTLHVKLCGFLQRVRISFKATA